jgi:hypothetical protein
VWLRRQTLYGRSFYASLILAPTPRPDEYDTYMRRYFLLLLVSGCAGPAQTYERRGMNGLALEYMREDPKTLDDGSRARVISALKRFARTERDEALARGATRTALAANLSLFEQDTQDADARASHTRLKHAAAEQENAKLDAMTERGVVHVADLQTCRRAQALEGGAEVQARCVSLRQRLQVHAVLSVAGPASVTTAIARASRLDAHDLFDIVPIADDNRNAVLDVSVVAPSVDEDTDWVEVEKRGRHVMAPTGKKEKVTVQPTQEEIDRAKRENKPAPQATIEEKPLYREVTGEYRLFRRVVTVAVPYAFALKRDREGVVTASGAGVREERVVSEYYEYSGSPAARDNPAGWPEGRQNARPLLSRKQLRDAAEAAISSEVVRAVVAHTEQE